MTQRVIVLTLKLGVVHAFGQHHVASNRQVQDFRFKRRRLPNPPFGFLVDLVVTRHRSDRNIVPDRIGSEVAHDFIDIEPIPRREQRLGRPLPVS